MSFDIDGLEKRPKQPDPSLTVYDLFDGTPLPIANPPGKTEDGYTPAAHEVAAIVMKPANALAFLERERRRVAEDQSLSEIGRQEKLRSTREAAQIPAKTANEELQKVAARAATWSADLYAPPKLEPTDLGAALIDQEIRNHVRGLKGEALTKYAQTIGAQPRHLEAIMRSPVPMTDVVSVAAKASWAEHVERTNPKVRDLVQLREAVAWGLMVLPNITAHL